MAEDTICHFMEPRG